MKFYPWGTKTQLQDTQKNPEEAFILNSSTVLPSTLRNFLGIFPEYLLLSPAAGNFGYKVIY
ncbi:MAG: hypothetical protein CM1200mP12_22610 [Gammaproteobacteria bacterium]|nr:MAG: hypothetical protein CM1200mP12_22610 [Gammaproteobacteria bacterium]